MDERLVQVVEKNKRLVFLLFLLIILFAAGIVTTFKVMKLEELEEERFPESILVSKLSEKTSYHKPSYNGKKISCPNLAYEIDVPGEMIRNHSNKFVSCYNNAYFTLYEGNDELSSALNDRFGNYFIDSVDIPRNNFEASITDEGYINGYAAEYQTGIQNITTKMHTYTYYIAAYEILTEPECSIFLMVACETLEELFINKIVLDEIVLSIIPFTDLSEETIKDKSNESVLNDMDKVYAPENEVQIKQENGVAYYEKDFTVYVNEEYKDGVYIVFKWINYMEVPNEMLVISPSGKEYLKDEELSEDGEWVFVIPDNEVGLYIIHGESLNTIYVNYYEAMSKNDYYATYKNLDITTGEPVRSFKEERT